MRKNIFFMVLILSLVFVILFPNINMAQSLDQMLVIDDANIFGDKITEIKAAAEELQNQGADVRVRTITSFGAYGNLDQYELQLEQRSPSWIGQNGDIKNNLIVLIISLEERETGLYYGEIWTNVLDDNWNRIQSDIMHPLFKDGDYAGGVIQGLKEIQRLIKEKDQTQSPTGQSKSWIIPLVFLIILVLVIGFFVFSRYRQNKAKISAVRQKAILAKQAAASGINELIEATQMLDIKVNVTADKIAPEEAVPLRNGLEKATGLVNRSSQAYSDLSHSAGNPENPRLGEAELGVIEPEYQKIVIDLRDARDAIKDVEARIAGVQQTIDGFPQKVTEVNTAIKEALNKENGLQTAGFKTTYIKDLINKSSETLGQANSLVAKRQYNEAMKFVGSANNQIQQAFQAMEDLPGKKQAAESAIPILASRIEEVKEKINDGGEVFERLSGEYAESTWEPIRGNGTEAENRVNWALDALGESQIDVGMEKQDWPEALKLVEKGNTWLTEAESLVKSITELEVNLMAARRDAPGEIN